VRGQQRRVDAALYIATRHADGGAAAADDTVTNAVCYRICIAGTALLAVSQLSWAQ
jgi:hypothetical protein